VRCTRTDTPFWAARRRTIRIYARQLICPYNDRPAVRGDTSGRGVSGQRAAQVIADLGFTHVVMIPDSESAKLFEAIHQHDQLNVISPVREGEGIAIAAGLWVGGKKPLIVIQNTGLMEAGDALRGCGVGPKIPLRLMVGWRGYKGAMAGTQPIDSAYPATEPLLAAWNIPTWHLMADEDLDVLRQMDDTAAETSSPAAVLTGWTFQ
jgi:sulfopyruvate decarboxylase subunit alpha